MEKYLLTLLDLNSRVIIPELGAFIIRQNDLNELVFNDLLAFDDGMLIDHIIQAEQLSKSEAQNRIRRFAETIGLHPTPKCPKSLQPTDDHFVHIAREGACHARHL